MKPLTRYQCVVCGEKKLLVDMAHCSGSSHQKTCWKCKQAKNEKADRKAGRLATHAVITCVCGRRECQRHQEKETIIP